jgi:prepilin-type N-terminal cleavage/methylation domain-containing protein
MLTAIRGRARGVTLLELLVVLMILSIILTAAVKTWDVTLERGRAETTSRKLNQLVSVIVGDRDYIVAGQRADFGFVGDIGRLPNNLQELVVSPLISPPESSRWRGPYLRPTFNESPDGFRIDGWGDTIIYNPDSLFLRSLGGRGLVDVTRWQTVYLPYDRNDLTGNTVDGQIVDVRGMAPPDSDRIMAGLTLTLYYPYEGKLMGHPLNGFNKQLRNGVFTFYPLPQGTFRLVAMYVDYNQHPADTTLTTADVTVYPAIGAHDIRMRLNLDWNDK